MPEADTLEPPVKPTYPTTKQLVENVLRMIPDDCTMEQVKYHLDTAEMIRERSMGLDSILEGCGSVEEAVRQGKLIPHEEVMRRMEQWLKK